MKVSIVVSVYNTAKYLEQCLGSIFNQTMNEDDYEVVIVNDGSTDNSMEVIKHITEGRKNVVVIDKPVNESTFWGRVDGMMAATGEYVGFIDSDDFIEEDMYETMYRKGIESRADIVECGTVYEEADGTTRAKDNREEKLMPAALMIKEYSERAIQVALYIRIFSRNVVERFKEEILPYFEARHEEYVGARTEDDLLFPLLFSRADKLLYISESFCHHRLEVQNSSMYVQRNNQKKYVDSYIFRVKAGFINMDFNKDNKEIYGYLSHKQINIIFALMGKLLETSFYTKEEAGRMIFDAIRTMDKKKRLLPIRDGVRYMHLRLKAIKVYGLISMGNNG